MNKCVWRVLSLGLVVGLMVTAAGCKSNKDLEVIEPDLDGAEPDDGTGNEVTTVDGLPNLDLENLLFDPASDSGLQTVYFGFDSFGLDPEALSVLRQNADKIKRVPGVVIQIAGHCDERGTQAYNFTLGEQRALAVREHLISLGVSGDRLITISYGEEFPAEFGSNEAAWAANRRCEFNRAQSR